MVALDEHVAELLTGLQQQGVKSFEQMPVEEVRATVASFTGMQAPAEQVAKVDETHYCSGEAKLTLKIYTPSGPGPHPVVLYFHGGGWVAGDLTVVDEPSRTTANDTGAIVVAAQYRLAPEHKFPAAANDAWAALNWVRQNIAEYNGDLDSIIVMGDSAGGNLAAVTALRARDENGPSLRGQVLIYPVIDPNSALPSRAEFAEGYLLTTAALDWFWEQYLSSPDDARNPYAVPTQSNRLDGLPPTLILTTENEALRDEAEEYGQLLWTAGVDVHTERFDGLVHGVFWMSGAVPRSAELRSAVQHFVNNVACLPG